jgi:uncharacterized membrane-anchored protein YjiN (DUF445 family)
VPRRKVPSSFAARLAWAIWLASVAAWLVSYTEYAIEELTYTPVRHALEGAIIGGFCDAYAIWRIYANIKREYQALSREVSRFVVHDVIKAERVMEDVRKALDAPSTTQALLEMLKEKFPSQRQLEARCLDFWERELHPLVLERVIKADLHAWLGETTTAGKLLDDPHVRSVVRRCLKAAVVDKRRATRLHKMLELSWFKSKLFNEERLFKELEKLATALDQPPQPGQTEGGKLLREYMQAYISAWSELTPEQRRAAAERTIDLLGPIVVRKVAELLWLQRDDIIDYLGSGAGISRHPFVELFANQLEPVVNRIPEILERAIYGKLERLGASGVRNLVEDNTRERLDYIQLNGTLLGAAIGFGVGSLAMYLTQ